MFSVQQTHMNRLKKTYCGERLGQINILHSWSFKMNVSISFMLAAAQKPTSLGIHSKHTRRHQGGQLSRIRRDTRAFWLWRSHTKSFGTKSKHSLQNTVFCVIHYLFCLNPEYITSALLQTYSEKKKTQHGSSLQLGEKFASICFNEFISTHVWSISVDLMYFGVWDWMLGRLKNWKSV